MKLFMIKIQELGKGLIIMSKTVFNSHRYVEGYRDPTAGEAIENVDRELKQKYKNKPKQSKGEKHGHKNKQ